MVKPASAIAICVNTEVTANRHCVEAGGKLAAEKQKRDIIIIDIIVSEIDGVTCSLILYLHCVQIQWVCYLMQSCCTENMIGELVTGANSQINAV